MTNEQAINILKEQIESVQWITPHTHQTWLTQTKSEIKKIFDVFSEEYSFLNGFKLVSPFSSDPTMTQITQNRKTIIDFLERCIKTIERDRPLKSPEPIIKYVDRPVYREIIKEVIKEVMVYPPKINAFRAVVNWFRRKDILALIGALAIILNIPFWTGWLIAENKGDIKNLDLKRDNKQLIKDTTTLGAKNRELSDSIVIYSTLDVSNAKPETSTERNKN